MRQLIILLSVVLFCVSCGDDDQRLMDDIETIKTYLETNDLEAQETSEGVFYIETIEGTGASPTVNDNVTAHYEGLYLDGIKFDSSYDQGMPLDFNLSGVIEGWQIGIPLFKEGGSGTLIIPSPLAYGENPRPGIRENAIMLFNIELISINN